MPVFGSGGLLVGCGNNHQGFCDLLGPFCARRNESASEHGAQALRDRLIENPIIERMEEGFPIALSGKKVPNIAIDRRGSRDLGLHREAFYGEAHGEVFLRQPEICLCHLGRVRCLT